MKENFIVGYKIFSSLFSVWSKDWVEYRWEEKDIPQNIEELYKAIEKFHIPWNFNHFKQIKMNPIPEIISIGNELILHYESEIKEEPLIEKFLILSENDVISNKILVCDKNGIVFSKLKWKLKE